MKISTTKLQAMMTKVVKGVGNNKLIPITSLIGITVEDGTLTIVSTDSTNYLYASEDIGEKTNFYVCVKADQFAKLVSKMTSEYITLTIKDNYLEVKGNGTYSIEIPLDENGEMVEYPNPIANLEDKITCKEKIEISTIKTILASVKNGLATTTDYPQLTNYYFGENVVATNQKKINALAKKITDSPILVSSVLVDLLDTITDEVVDMIVYEGGDIEFVSEAVTLFGHVAEGIDEFPIDALNSLISKDYNNYCKVSKLELLQVLDRISLFVDDYDKGAISLSFGDALTIRSNKLNSEEAIAYRESNATPSDVYTVYIDIEMLQSQIKSQESDTVTIYFGEDKAIKLVDGDLTFIIALIQK